MTLTSNTGFPVPYSPNVSFSLGNQTAAQNPSTLAINSFDLRNQFQYGGRNLSTHAIPALPNAVFDPITSQEFVSRTLANLNEQQLQSLLMQFQGSAPQTDPFALAPVHTSEPNASLVTAGCKRANGNNPEESMTPDSKRSNRFSDDTTTSLPYPSSNITGTATVRVPGLQFPSQNSPTNLPIPGTSNPITAAANAVRSSPLSDLPPNLPPDLNGNNALITHCAFFNEDGKPVESVQVCRDFLAGRCTRGINCNYVHVDNPRDLEIVNNRVQLCRDAIGDRCTRSRCRFYHIPEEILESHRRQYINNIVQSSSFPDNHSFSVNASDAEAITVSASASNDDALVPVTVNNSVEALSSASCKAEGDSGNSESSTAQLHSTTSSKPLSSKSAPSESC